MDVVAPPSALIDIWEGVQAGALNFTCESDGKIAFDAPQGFRIRVDFIEIGTGCIERIHAVESYSGASIASMSDLLLLRAVTVVDRGKDGDVLDFNWLLEQVAKVEALLPEIDDVELEYLRKAAQICLGEVGRFVVAALLGPSNAAATQQLLS